MGEDRSIRDVRGIVLSLREGVLEWRGAGALLREDMLETQRRTDEILATTTGRLAALADGSAIESFEAGMPWLGAKWMIPRVHRFSRFALVGRRGPMLGIASTFQVLLPTLTVRIFTERDAALAFARSHVDIDARATGGRAPRP